MMLGNKGLKKELNKHSALVLDIHSFGVSRPWFAPLSFATLSNKMYGVSAVHICILTMPLFLC